MPTQVDTLYADLELRTVKFEAQVRGADRQLNDLGRRLEGLPASSAIAASGLGRHANELSTKIDRIIYKYEELQKTVDLTNAKEVAAFRERLARAEQNIRAMGANTQQIAGMSAAVVGFESRVTQGTASVTDFGQKGAVATRVLASGIENMARTGTEGIGALKGGIASFAGVLGPGGILASALVFATAAVVEYFSRAREESEKTRQKVMDDLKQQTDARRREADPVGSAQERRTVAATEVEKLGPELERGIAAYHRLTAAAAAATAAGGEGAEALTAQAAKAAAHLRDLQVRFSEAARSVRTADHEIAEAVERLKDAEADRYSQLIQGRNASAAEQARAAQLLVQYRAELEATTGADRDAQEQRIRLLQRIAALTKQVGSARLGELGDSPAIEAANKALDALRKNRALLNAEIADQAVAATKTLVDDMLLELGRFEQQLRDAKLTGDQIAIFTKPKKAAIALQEKIEELAKDNLPALSAAAKKGLTELNALVERPLQGKVDNPFDLGPYLQQQDKAKSAALELGRNIEMSARAGLQLAEAFGLVNEETSRTLQGVTQIAASIPGILSGNPAAMAAGISSAAGGLASLIGSLRQRREEDPAAVAQREALQKNSERLEELRLGIDKLTLSLTGRETSAIRDVPLTAITNQPAPFTGISLPREDFRPVAEILADLRKAGVSLDELRKAAADFGITLSASPTIAELQQLQEAIKTFSLEKLLNTFDGQMRMLELRMRMNPEAFKGLDGVLERIKVLTGTKGVPAIADALKGLDPAAPDFASKAIERLMALFDNIGSLPLEAFGDIDPSELPELITTLVEELLAATPPVKTALQQFTEAFAILQESFEVNGTDAAGRAKALAELFAKSFGEFEGLTTGGGLASLDQIKERFQNVFSAAIADGSIDESERAVIDAFRALIGAMEAEIDQAAVRAQAQADAEQDIRVRELRATGFSDAADALERQLKNEAELAALRLAGVSEATVAQLAMVQALEASAAAAQKAANAARAQADVASDINIEFLRKTGKDKEADRAEIDRRHNARVAKAVASGFSQETVDQINAIHQAELDEWNKKWGAAAGAVADAVTEASGRGSGASGPTSVSERASFTLVEGTRIADYLARGLNLDGVRNALLEDIRDRLGTLTPIAPPSLPAWFGSRGGGAPPRDSARGAGGEGGIVLHAAVNFYGPVSVADANDFGRDLLPWIAQGVDRAMGTQLNVQRALAGRSALG
jgi:hypothetical protein